MALPWQTGNRIRRPQCHGRLVIYPVENEQVLVIRDQIEKEGGNVN